MFANTHVQVPYFFDKNINMFSLKISRSEFYIGISAFFLYFVSRLFNIMSLPIFTDEAIYTRWSQIARFDASWRFISLTDGKQPLFVWLDMILMRFVHDPLLAGRLVSVLAGFLTMIGLFFLGKTLFNKKIGTIAVFLYIIFPFALVYDRMALYDSLVATGAVWSLLFEILLIKHKRLDLSLVLGMILGASVLTKTIGFIFIYLLPFSLFLFKPNNKDNRTKLMKWGGLALVSVAFAYFYYSVLRLSPFYHIINEKNTIFVYPIKEWLTHPFEFFGGNLHALFDWIFVYSTPPFLILMVLSVLGKKIREKLLLFSWFILPILALGLIGRTLYPRFVLFMSMPLLVLAAYSLDNLLVRLRLNKVLVALFFITTLLVSDYFIINDFARAPVPKADLTQYMNDWPAGGGTKEVISYLNEKASKGKIYVASLGTFGSLPTYAVEIYLGDNKNVDKKGIYPVPSEIPKDLLEKAKTVPVYVFVSNQKEFEAQIKTWPIRELLRYRKGVGNSFAHLYEVKI